MAKTKKKSLGKGLSALIGGDNDSFSANDIKRTAESSGSLKKIDIKKIIPSPHQPRSQFPADTLKELAASIKELGLIEPIIVRSNGPKYELIAGERRFRAAKLAGFTSIPALIQQAADDKVLEMILVENIQREDLTPLEEAGGYQAILERKKITHDQLSRSVGKSRSHITNLLRLLNLPAKIKTSINSGALTMGHARVLSGLEEKKQQKLFQAILGKGLSVRQAEDFFVSRGTTKKGTGKPAKKDTHLKAIEEKLRDKYKTKVTLKPLKQGTGQVIIEYYSYDDLDAIVKKR